MPIYKYETIGVLRRSCLFAAGNILRNNWLSTLELNSNFCSHPPILDEIASATVDRAIHRHATSQWFFLSTIPCR